MAAPKVAIADAFERLKRSVSLEHAHEFASTSLKDVWSAVRSIQNEQRKRQSAQNLRRIEPLMRGIEKYAKVIEVLCNGTPYLPYVWIASHHRDIFDALLDAYAEIGEALPRFDRYEEAFKGNEEFQTALAGVYSTILDFHQRAYKFLQRKAWHNLFLSSWTDFRSRFEGILDALKRQRDFIDKEASSIHLVEEKDGRARMLQDIEERQQQAQVDLELRENERRIRQLQCSIEWLAIDDRKQEAEFLRRLDLQCPGTCEWIQEVPEMRAWLEDDARNLMVWLNGKPGAGKTTLCAYVLQMLKQIEGLSICYYFCNDQDDGDDNPCERILGTVAIQLLRSHPESASLISNEFIARGFSSGLAQLRILVPKLLSIQPHTRIVIDGIDECSKRIQKALLAELQRVFGDPEIRCKVLISSRKEPSIKEHLSQKSQISLDKNKKVEQDIRRYISREIEGLRKDFGDQLDSEVLHNIQLLAEKADGMFLWVKLVISELQSSFTKRDLKERVKNIPHGLEAAYGRILDRMSDGDEPLRNRALSMRILEWMACSYRRLKFYEILDGVAFRPESTSLDNDTKMQRRVLDLCRPLIEDGPSNTVVFVHFSAKEYILKKLYREGRPFIRVEDAHFNISFSCIAYLNTSFSLLPLQSTEGNRMLAIFDGLHGLQIYTNQFWFRHLVAYMDHLNRHKLESPKQLSIQLEKLLALAFRKERQIDNSSTSPDRANLLLRKPESESLQALNAFPELQALVYDIELFRKTLSRPEWTGKSPEDLSQESCSVDPTWFSSIRHYYQMSVEQILSPSFSNSGLTNFDTQALQKFREIYSNSAFVCRYLHCSRAFDGFDSVQQRMKHESQHQRKFRCRYSACASFLTRFTTETRLKRHNDTYHPKVTDGGSLAETIKSIKDEQSGDEEGGDKEGWYKDDRKYCMCQSVGYGRMVACDNEACPYEWFHWTCVGLKSAPVGTWLCPVCTKNIKK